MATLKILQTSAQYLFFLVSLRYFSVNWLYKCFCEEKSLYSKQFGFQKSYSTDHAIVHLVDQIYEFSENDSYILGVFIDLSKVFDSADHSFNIAKKT